MNLKKEAIKMATSLIALMNSNEKLSDEDLEKLSGGHRDTNFYKDK
jgi:hypothetical protein